MDDISLSARERRTLHELEKILRRQDRLLGFRMRSAGRWAGPPKREPNHQPNQDPKRDPRRQPQQGPAPEPSGEPGRCFRALTVLSAALLALAIHTSGRLTRRVTALAFGAVWLFATLLAPRGVRR